MKELGAQGKKQEAVGVMKQYKEAKAEYDEYIAQNPEALTGASAPVVQKKPEEAKKPS